MAATKVTASKTKKANTGALKSGSTAKQGKTAATTAQKTVMVGKTAGAAAANKSSIDAPGAKKSAPVKADARVAGKKTVAASSKVTADKKKGAKLTPEERYRMVETAAYFIAERNGFRGDTAAHWAAAELEITALLKE